MKNCKVLHNYMTLVNPRFTEDKIVYDVLNLRKLQVEGFTYCRDNPYLPIVTADTLDDFPEVGFSTKLYIDLSTNLVYRWDGTEYILLAGSVPAIRINQVIFVDSINGSNDRTDLEEEDIFSLNYPFQTIKAAYDAGVEAELGTFHIVVRAGDYIESIQSTADYDQKVIFEFESGVNILTSAPADNNTPYFFSHDSTTNSGEFIFIFNENTSLQHLSTVPNSYLFGGMSDYPPVIKIIGETNTFYPIAPNNISGITLSSYGTIFSIKEDGSNFSGEDPSLMIKNIPNIMSVSAAITGDFQTGYVYIEKCLIQVSSILPTFSTSNFSRLDIIDSTITCSNFLPIGVSPTVAITNSEISCSNGFINNSSVVSISKSKIDTVNVGIKALQSIEFIDSTINCSSAIPIDCNNSITIRNSKVETGGLNNVISEASQIVLENSEFLGNGAYSLVEFTTIPLNPVIATNITSNVGFSESALNYVVVSNHKIINDWTYFSETIQAESFKPIGSPSLPILNNGEIAFNTSTSRLQAGRLGENKTIAYLGEAGYGKVIVVDSTHPNATNNRNGISNYAIDAPFLSYTSGLFAPGALQTDVLLVRNMTISTLVVSHTGPRTVIFENCTITTDLREFHTLIFRNSTWTGRARNNINFGTEILIQGDRRSTWINNYPCQFANNVQIRGFHTLTINNTNTNGYLCVGGVSNPATPEGHFKVPYIVIIDDILYLNSNNRFCFGDGYLFRNIVKITHTGEYFAYEWPGNGSSGATFENCNIETSGMFSPNVNWASWRFINCNIKMNSTTHPLAYINSGCFFYFKNTNVERVSGAVSVFIAGVVGNSYIHLDSSHFYSPSAPIIDLSGSSLTTLFAVNTVGNNTLYVNGTVTEETNLYMNSSFLKPLSR